MLSPIQISFPPTLSGRTTAGGEAAFTICWVVVCPKDLVMFQDALKTTGLGGRLEVRELSELVEQAMG